MIFVPIVQIELELLLWIQEKHQIVPVVQENPAH
jgi:hypothetical protein